MKNKYFVISVIFILLFSFYYGCSKKEETSRITTLTLSIWGKPNEPDLVSIISQFEKEHPKIKIKLICIPASNYYAKLQTMIAGGTPPDVAWLGYQQLKDFASKGVLLELEPSLGKSKDFDINSYYSLVVESLKFKGKLYGLARYFHTFVLYYNKDMFDEAKIKYPDSSWDWNKFLEAAKKLTKDKDGDGRIDQFGFRPESWLDSWLWWVWSNGGDLLNKEMTECLLDKPESIEAIQFVADMRLKHKIAPSLGQAKDLGGSGADMMKAGQLAMYVNGRWVARFLAENKKLNFDCAPVPSGKIGRFSVLFPIAYVIIKGTKNSESAWEFLKFVGGEKGNSISGSKKIGAGIPAVRKVAESKVFIDETLPPKNDRVFLEAAEKYARLLPINEKYGQIEALLNNEMDLVWLGQKTAEEICKKLKKEIDEVLKN